MKRQKITVVIPTKNEAGGIVKVVRGAKPFADEIIVVDGSVDQTADLARRAGAKVILEEQGGVGAAKRLGIAKAKGDIIVLMDADGSHEPRDIPKLVEPIKKNQADLVLASRVRGGSDEFYVNLSGLVRQTGGDLVSFVVNRRFKTNLTDTINGYRAIRRSTALKIGLTADDFDIEQEMVIRCLKKKYRVCEVASHEYARGWGKGKLPTFSKGWVFIWSLFKELI